MAEVGRGVNSSKLTAEIDCWPSVLRRENTISFETDELLSLLRSDIGVMDPRQTFETVEAEVGLQGRRDRLTAETAEARRNYRPAMNCRDYIIVLRSLRGRTM